MADPVTIKLFCEGDDDRALLKVISDAGLMPERIDIDANKNDPGKEGLAKRAWSHLPCVGKRQLAGRVIVLRDLDDLALPQVHAWFGDALKHVVQGTETTLAREEVPEDEGRGFERLAVYRVASGEYVGRVAVIGVGLPEERERHHGIAQFAGDDYVLRALRDPEVYETAQQSEKDNGFRTIPRARSLHKLGRVIEVLRDAEGEVGSIPVDHSKRVTQIFRGLTDFRGSQATFCARLMSSAMRASGGTSRESFLQPLLDDLRNAAALLRA